MYVSFSSRDSRTMRISWLFIHNMKIWVIYQNFNKSVPNNFIQSSWFFYFLLFVLYFSYFKFNFFFLHEFTSFLIDRRLVQWIRQWISRISTSIVRLEKFRKCSTSQNMQGLTMFLILFKVFSSNRKITNKFNDYQ